MASLGISLRRSPPPSLIGSTGPEPARLWSRAYLRILAVQMCFGLSYSAFLLLPKYLRAELQASATEIGWATGSALVVSAVAAPLVGTGGNLLPKRWLLFGGMIASSLAAFIFLAVDRIGPLLYFARLLQGLAFVAVFNSTAVLVANQVDRSRMAQAIGYLGVSMLATNALAPAVTEPLAQLAGWGIAFASAGVLALVASLWVLDLKEAPETDTTGQPSAVAGAHDRSLLGAYYASVLVGVGLGVMFTFIQPFALQLGAERVGDFFFGYVASAVFVRTALARVADRVGAGRVALVALVLYGAVVVAAAALTPALLVAFGLGLGAAHGLIYPALTAFALSRVTPRHRAGVMGWLAGSYNAGFAVCVLGLGPVADRTGFPAIFLVAGLIVLSGVIPLHRAVRTRPAPHQAGHPDP